MAKALTVKSIEAVKATNARLEVPDGGLKGLYLVVQPTGAKSWAVRYRHGGQTRKMTIGAYPLFGLADARQAAGSALRIVADGRDPAAEREARERARPAAITTVESAFEDFVKRHSKVRNRESTIRENQRFIANEICPAWKGRDIQSISRHDVVSLLDRLLDRGIPHSANRVHALIRKAFNWFVERGVVSASPCDGVKAPAGLVSRDRVLSSDELILVWRSSEIAGWPFGPFVRLLLLTGQRRDEVAGADWNEFDLDAKEPSWTIPKERTKNGKAHTVALAPASVEILRSLTRVADDQGKVRLVFTTTGGTPISGFSRGKSKLDRVIATLAEKGAKEGRSNPARVDVAPWRLHDLRRTAASGMAGLGIQPHVIEKVLNHQSGTIRGVAAVYNRHSYAAERQRALIVWADHIARLVRDTASDNILRLRDSR